MTSSSRRRASVRQDDSELPRLADSRVETTVLRAVSVSPGYGAVKFQIVDSEKWACRFAQVLDAPTTVHATSIGLTTTSG